jgi:hypothetical protein
MVGKRCTRQYQTNHLRGNPFQFIASTFRWLHHCVFHFSTTPSFKFVGLHQSVSGKLVSTILPNNPRLSPLGAPLLILARSASFCTNSCGFQLLSSIYPAQSRFCQLLTLWLISTYSSGDVTISRCSRSFYSQPRASVALEPTDPALSYRLIGWYTCH